METLPDLLEAVVFPCACYETDVMNPTDRVCHCRQTRDGSEDPAKALFTLSTWIPHIDSDEDEELSLKCTSSGVLNQMPRDVTIKDIPEKLLTCGITFPGTRDLSGRPIVIIDQAELTKLGELNCCEIATLLLYYTALPCEDSLPHDIAILVLLDGSDQEADRLRELLDTTLLLLRSRVSTEVVLIWEPEKQYDQDEIPLQKLTRPACRRQKSAILPCSRIKCYRCQDLVSLRSYISIEHIPERCGGSARHDQAAWTLFFREFEALREFCSQVEHRARSWTIRRHLPGLLQALAQCAEAVATPDSPEIAAALFAAGRMAADVDRACARRLRGPVLEHETQEVSTWLCLSAEDALQSYCSHGSTQHMKRQERALEHVFFRRGLEESTKSVRVLQKLLLEFSEHLETSIERFEDRGDSGIGACANCEERSSCYSERCDMSNCTDELENDSFDLQNSIIKSRIPLKINSHLHCRALFDAPNAELETADSDPKTHKTLLLITREMIQTERDYVKSLDYIIEHYLPELLRDDIPQALRGQRNIVFGNVEKIYEFHNQHFLHDLELCGNTPLQIGRSFLRHEKMFYLYALYNKNKPKSDSLMSEYGSVFFKSKQLELCDKMDLASYLLKPVQRMGKYALLLQQLMKATSHEIENSSDLEDLRAAERMVRFQLRHGNDLLAMDSLRECDVNVKEQGRLLRQNEFLVWEGKSGKKSLRQVFLFEDLILFSKARRFPDQKNLDIYLYKSSIKTSDIGLTARIDDSSTKFEIWFRKRKPNDTFILQPMSEEIKMAWTEEISQLLWKQALRNRESRLAEMSSMGIGNKPCLDIRPSVDQINDRSISIAQISKTASRFRNSMSSFTISEITSCASRRPRSVISVNSVSSGSGSSSSGSSGTTHMNTAGLLTHVMGSGVPRHRSATLHSQCSTESGILADIPLGDDLTSTSNHIWNGLSKCYSSASSTDIQKDRVGNAAYSNITDVTHNVDISNCSSYNQIPLLLYQNDPEISINL